MAENVDEVGRRTISLGDLEPAGSRHTWRRSSVHVRGDRTGARSVIVGRSDGTVTAFDPDSLETQWERTHPESAVTIASLESADLIVVGGRGANGTVAAYDGTSGERRWSFETSTTIGTAATDRLFSQPYVVALESVDERCYVASRRYERDGQERNWESVVAAIEADGTVRWRYETDASPIALSVAESERRGGRDDDEDGDDGGRIAVAYNRCPGDHAHGVVVLEAASGTPAWTWDPGTEGDRRVGDVAFVDGSKRLAVASHGDKRGYLLGPGGEEAWRVDLATETQRGEETLYAYPNHVRAADGIVAFVTGNTYALERRETEFRHPNEHSVFAFDAAGDALWDANVRGFTHEFCVGGDRFVAACAQHFRVRDPETHGIRWFDRSTGEKRTTSIDGVVTAVDAGGDVLAAIEEPVEYHDEGVTHGEYVGHVVSS